MSEFPDEVTLIMNLSRCPNHCEGCHAPYLSDDIGEVLTPNLISELINSNEGITCIGFMGGDNDPGSLNKMAMIIKSTHQDLKVGWYSGKSELPDCIDIKYFDYIKLGPYKPEFGPLKSRTTNQKFYKIFKKSIQGKEFPEYELIDCTSIFWRK